MKTGIKLLVSQKAPHGQRVIVIGTIEITDLDGQGKRRDVNQKHETKLVWGNFCSRESQAGQMHSKKSCV